jgi:hypothetical protein
MTTTAALVAEVREHGVELTPTPEGKLRVRPVSRLPPALLGALRERKSEVWTFITTTVAHPDEPQAVELRVRAFRRQIETWTAANRPGVPLLTLPDASTPDGTGRCVSCGAPALEWRCSPCLTALRIALNLPAPPTEDRKGEACSVGVAGVGPKRSEQPGAGQAGNDGERRTAVGNRPRRGKRPPEAAS